ncbi:MAG TPA: polysaccharide biosynthesis tyrosine autokinase [Afifellaceae bacterium]|nr:polysaccharide biosynthesis tyrosine autokinase [Afifellaceae bacterium]
MLKRSSDPSHGQAPTAGAEVDPWVGGGDGAFDFREIFRIAQRRLPVIAGLALLGTLTATIYAFQLTPQYTASATLMIEPRKTTITDSQAVLSDIGKDWEAIESEVELIRSLAVARRVAVKLGLAGDEAVAQPEPTISGLLDSVSLIGPERQPILEPDAITPHAYSVRGGLSVSRKRDTYLIQISYTHRNPQFAARAANAFAEAYLVDQLEAKFEATRHANSWLDSRLSEMRDRVRESERAVEAYRAEHNLAQSDGETLTERQVSELNQQLVLARAKTAEARATLEQVREVLGRGGEASSFANPLLSQAVAQLRGRLSELKRELAELGAKYGSRHPAVVNVRAQMADVERQIGDEAQRILASSENAYRAAISREESIADSLREIKGEAAEMSQAEIRLRELEREAAANRALFESFLARFKETSQQATLQMPDSRIIEAATVPGAPSKPNRKSIIIMGFLLSLAGGAGLALLLEQLDNGFRTGRQVEEVFGAPLLASVPMLEEGHGETSLAGLLEQARRGIGERLPWLGMGADSPASGQNANARRVLDKPLSPFTEAIRSLRMGIRYASLDQPPRTILVTSALPGEGKSTLAANLAQHAANTGEKVLMIDMDLRRPTLTAIHAPDAQDGLVELLTGEALSGDVVRIDPETGLRFIPASRSELVTHAAEVLGSRKVKDFLWRLRDIFDLIVIDSSPLLPVTDSRALVAAVDAVVFVVRWETTGRDAVRSALRQTFGLDQKLLGVVLNQVNVSRARYYDYYKSGYYMAEYAHGTADAEA